MSDADLLRKYDLRITPQRLEIVSLMHKFGHINIDDLYKSLLVKFPSLSLATIYKNLNTMCKKMFLIEVKIPNYKTVYELAKEDHSHIVCSNCNCITDVQLDMSSILNQAQTMSGYSFDASSIVLSGCCPKCSLLK